MHVCFVLSSLSAGGAERVASSLCNYFCCRGHEVSIVLASIDHNNSFYELNKRVNVYPLLSKGISKNPIKRVRILRNKIIELKPDIVVSFLHHICVYTYFALKGTHIPFVCSERNDPHSYKWYVKMLLKKAFSHASGCVFQTEDASRYYKNCKNKTIIPNPVFLNVDISKTVNQEKEKMFLSVGRLTKQKNFDLLIKSFARFLERHPDYSLTIYGEGPLRTKLEKTIKRLNIDGKVFLPGTNNAWHSVALKATCFISSSDFEGMPNCLEEAICLGCMSIATDCPVGGSREIIKLLGNGILIDVNDEEQLVDAMCVVVNSKKNSVIPDYSFLKPECIGERWLDFFKALTSN